MVKALLHIVLLHHQITPVNGCTFFDNILRMVGGTITPSLHAFLKSAEQAKFLNMLQG